LQATPERVLGSHSPFTKTKQGATMSITNERRHHLYQRLEQVLGEEEATTMMDHLPPVGWADVATKDDLRMLGLELRAEMHKGQRDLAITLIGTNAAFTGLLFAAITLTS
jgi:hypothetical protein